MQPSKKKMLAVLLGVVAIAVIVLNSFRLADFAVFLHANHLARPLYLISAVLGDARAQNNVAGMYADGSGGFRNEKQAVYWFEKAASAGVVAAQFNLANFYAEGRGVPRSEKRAIELFELAANSGDVESAFNLGVLYASGSVETPIDYAMATTWYLRAARTGYASAQYNLGGLFANGLNGPKNLTKARFWFEQAAAQGHPKAQLDLGTMLAYGLTGHSDVNRGLSLLSNATKNPTTADQARKRIDQICSLEKSKGSSLANCNAH